MIDRAGVAKELAEEKNNVARLAITVAKDESNIFNPTLSELVLQRQRRLLKKLCMKRGVIYIAIEPPESCFFVQDSEMLSTSWTTATLSDTHGCKWP